MLFSMFLQLSIFIKPIPCYNIAVNLTVCLAGLMSGFCNALDIFSLSVGISGMLTTVQNTTLTLLGSLGVVKGGISMVVFLLVVGVYGMSSTGSR